MKENTVVLSLEELDRLRDIEKNHKIMLEGGVYCEIYNNFNSFSHVVVYEKESFIEKIEEENEKILNDYYGTIRRLEEENKKLKNKKWFNIF